MMKLKVASLNTWNCQGLFARRLPLMVEGLKAMDADIVLLQEVFSQVPNGLNVAARLARELGLNFAFAPARRKLRKLNNAPVLCYSGLAVLCAPPIISAQSVRLPMDVRDGERLGQIVEVEVNGVPVKIGNVHLTHLDDGDDLRARQLEEFSRHLHVDDAVCILGGDMNARQGSLVFAPLGDFSPSDMHVEGELSSLNPVNGTPPTSGIVDHIFVKPLPGGTVASLASLNLDVPDPKRGLFPSDHKAIVASIHVEARQL